MSAVYCCALISVSPTTAQTFDIAVSKQYSNFYGFCHFSVDIRPSARARVCVNERTCGGGGEYARKSTGECQKPFLFTDQASLPTQHAITGMTSCRTRNTGDADFANFEKL